MAYLIFATLHSTPDPHFVDPEGRWGRQATIDTEDHQSAILSIHPQIRILLMGGEGVLGNPTI